MELRHILVAVEPTPQGEAALAIATRLARARACALHRIRGFDSDADLAHEARTWNADLVVIGTAAGDDHPPLEVGPNRNDLDAIASPPKASALGVCLKSPCPVLVTHGGHERHAPRAWGFRRPLVAVDYSPLSEPGARVAIALAERDGVVDLLHAFCPHSPGEGLSPGLERPAATPALDEERAHELRRLFAFADRVDNPAVSVECHVEIGQAAHQIVDHVGRQENDLVVVGAHGRNTELQRALGTVTDRVIRHATVPIVLIPESLAALR